jgi:DNA invertase Pin-like site-specific DNA recombinase
MQNGRALDSQAQRSTNVLMQVETLARLLRPAGGSTRAVFKGVVANRRSLAKAISLNTATPTGRLMLNVIGSVTQFEREMMLERQREDIAKAKGEGKYKGRKPTGRAKGEVPVSKIDGNRPYRSKRPADVSPAR